MRPQEGLLDDVLGVLVVPREPPGQVVGGGEERQDQPLELRGRFVRIRLAQETPP